MGWNEESIFRFCDRPSAEVGLYNLKILASIRKFCNSGFLTVGVRIEQGKFPYHLNSGFLTFGVWIEQGKFPYNLNSEVCQENIY